MHVKSLFKLQFLNTSIVKMTKLCLPLFPNTALNVSSCQPHVEVTLTTSNDTIIKAVLIFAEGIFEVG